MKKAAFLVIALFALVTGCKERIVFLPVPVTLVESWTVQGNAGTFYEDTRVYAVDFGEDANAKVSLSEGDTLVNIYIESVTLTVTDNRIPGSRGSCYLRFKRNSGDSLTLVGITDLVLDEVLDVTTPLVPNPVAVDTLQDFLFDAMSGSNDTLYIWVTGETEPDSVDFDVEFTITFVLLKALKVKVL